MKFEIHKRFDFCYGHRVWSQQLQEQYSIDTCLMCRHLHGHQGEIIVTLEGNNINANSGMITDFKHLNFFKKFIDDELDHKFIIDKNDPLFRTIFSKELNIIYEKYYHRFDLSKLNGAEKELYESAVIVDFIPTSENLSNWLFKIIENEIRNLAIEHNFKVKSVEFKETPKTGAITIQK